MSCYKYCIWYL